MSASQQSVAQSHRGTDFGISMSDVNQAQGTGAISCASVPTDESTPMLGSTQASFSLNSDGTLHRSHSDNPSAEGAMLGTSVPQMNDDE